MPGQEEGLAPELFAVKLFLILIILSKLEI